MELNSTGALLMLMVKPDTFDDMLPACACKREMRDKVRDLAEQNHTSEATIIRTAVEFFLQAQLNSNSTAIR
jgi:hypothetical protein